MRVEICLFAGESRFGYDLGLNLCFRVVEHTAVAMLYPVSYVLDFVALLPIVGLAVPSVQDLDCCLTR